MGGSAKTIGSKDAKIGEAQSHVGGLKQSHGRDSGTPTAVTQAVASHGRDSRKLTAVTPDSGQSRP